MTLYHESPNGQIKRKKKGKKASKPEPIDPNQPAIVIHSVDFEGPLYESWPPRSHSRIFLPRVAAEHDRVYAGRVLAAFMRRAYRRPVTDIEVEEFLGLYDRLRSTTNSLESTIQEVLALVLISPDFLYLVEPQTEPKSAQPLSDIEFASRLSYFLWSSMPDERLFELAVSQKLTDPRILKAEIDRMLANDRSNMFIENFTDQWLGLSGLDRIAVNPEFYPGFDDRLKQDMRKETQLFFGEILNQNISSLNLIQSDFTMLNYRLAKHYNISGPRGRSFERVALPADSERGGLLSQGSFLLINSNGEDSHPIKRAVWLLDRLLDDPPAPPPPDVPDLNSEQSDFANLPLKQQLERHRNKASCNDCHRRIDPWGIAFENFDAVGHWRTEVSGRVKRKQRHPVDATTVLPDGRRLNGVRELTDYLKQNRAKQFARALVKRLLTYALGRSLEFSDETLVQRLTNNFIQDDYRLHGLILAIATSEAFMTK